MLEDLFDNLKFTKMFNRKQMNDQHNQIEQITSLYPNTNMIQINLN